jgi:hypothetical protein
VCQVGWLTYPFGDGVGDELGQAGPPWGAVASGPGIGAVGHVAQAVATAAREEGRRVLAKAEGGALTLRRVARVCYTTYKESVSGPMQIMRMHGSQ